MGLSDEFHICNICVISFATFTLFYFIELLDTYLLCPETSRRGNTAASAISMRGTTAASEISTKNNRAAPGTMYFSASTTKSYSSFTL
jgi:hypothetical protein